jgi:hypothetical protein
MHLLTWLGFGLLGYVPNTLYKMDINLINILYSVEDNRLDISMAGSLKLGYAPRHRFPIHSSSQIKCNVTVDFYDKSREK